MRGSPQCPSGLASNFAPTGFCVMHQGAGGITVQNGSAAGGRGHYNLRQRICIHAATCHDANELLMKVSGACLLGTDMRTSDFRL